MTPSLPVRLLVVGPPRHGVVRFGIELFNALSGLGDGHGWPLERRSHAAESDTSAGRSGAGVHVQFTDHLFGDSPEEAAHWIGTLTRGLRADGAKLTVTLHDLPQPSDGPMFSRRAACYASVVAASHGVVVNSRHEAALLTEADVHAEVAVIPLPISPAPERVRDSTPPSVRAPTVGILGYLYPGKGHAEVISCSDVLPSSYEVLALGEPSVGHAGLVQEFKALAAFRGRRFRITGHVPDAQLQIALRAVDIPVVPHRHVSASGSLNAWLSAERRPLVAANRYTREVERRNPGALALYDDTPSGLRAALSTTCLRPADTWVTGGSPLRPSPAEAAADYAATLQQWHR